jgi:GxxExxY protein
MGNYKFEEITSKIIGAAVNVHKTLKSGLPENIYQRALKIELRNQKVAVETEKEIKIYYEGEKVGTQRLDLVVNNMVIVELKAIKGLEDINKAQLLSYLKASGLKIGLLLNFGKPVLEIKRLVM